jgi:hypothetical protein
MKPTRILPILLLVLALLAACNALTIVDEPGAAEPTSAPVVEVPATPTEAVVVEEPTPVPPPAETGEPEPAEPAETPEAPPVTLPPGALNYTLGSIYDESRGSWVLRGIAHDGDGWVSAALPFPDGVDGMNAAYYPPIHQALVWVYTPGAGAGVANMAAGPLLLVDFNTQTAAPLVPGSVLSAGWAPNGQGFAYIRATDTTYELVYRDPAGADRVLAGDVPRELSFDPTGQSIAFTRESRYNLGGAPGIYVVDIASGAERQVSAVDRAGMGGSDAAWHIKWSPGGESLIMRAFAEGGSEQLAWAGAGGAWSHAVDFEDINAAASAALGIEDACNNGELYLIGPTTLVLGAGPCPDEPLMGDFPEATHVAVLELDPASGALTPTTSVAAPANIFTFVDWDPATRTFVLSAPLDPAGNDIYTLQLP